MLPVPPPSPPAGKPPKLGDAERTCQTCAYSVKVSPSQSRCHRFPPSVKPPASPVPPDWSQPLVNAFGFCGEHRRADVEHPELEE